MSLSLRVLLVSWMRNQDQGYEDPLRATGLSSRELAGSLVGLQASIQLTAAANDYSFAKANALQSQDEL